MEQYSKYKLFRKYITSDGVNYTPIADYQAFDLNKANQCDCGYRTYENRFDGEYICSMEMPSLCITNFFYKDDFNGKITNPLKSPWIDTGILAKPSLKYKIKFTAIQTMENSNTMISAKNVVNKNENYNITYFYNGKTSDWEISFEMPSGAKISKVLQSGYINMANEMEIGNFYIDDVKGEKQVFEPKYGNVMLLYENNINNNPNICNIYYWKIYDNDVLVRDYVPKVINHICGLWDKVEGKFYPSQGETNFDWLVKTFENPSYNYKPYSKYEIWNQHALCPDDPNIDEITKKNAEYKNPISTEECGYYPDLIFEGKDEQYIDYRQIHINGNFTYIHKRPPVSINLRQDLGYTTIITADSCFVRLPITKLISFPDTTNCFDTSTMFYSNNSNTLQEINLSGHTFKNVRNAKYMFARLNVLTKIIGFNDATFEKCHSFERMFWECLELESIDVSGLNTSSSNNLKGMFEWCRSLTSLDVSSFNTSRVTNIESMFESCKSISELDLSNFDTRKIERMNYLFNRCNKLATINMSNWVINCYLSDIFTDCTSLKTIIMDNCDCETINKIIEELNIAGIRNQVTIYSNTGCEGTIGTEFRPSGEFICGSELVTNIPYISNVGKDGKMLNAYMKTGVKVTNKIKQRIKFETLISSGGVMIGGSKYNSDTSDYRIFYFSSDLYFDIPGEGSYGKRLNISSSKNTIYDYMFDNFSITDMTNGQVKASSSSNAFNDDVGELQFGCKVDGLDGIDGARIYQWQIYDGDNMVRDYIPKVVNGKVGLYDKIENKFYPSEGSEEFSSSATYDPISKYEIWEEYDIYTNVKTGKIEYRNPVKSEECGYIPPTNVNKI